ncbi:MAG: hypothetical protein KIT70_07355 [Anaerolineales bacterium]|nr:MAG: hypothetical protein KIT70_07355 [Anaerolineales bacterium]
MFGSIDGEEVHLNEFGLVAQQNWQAIPSHFAFVTLDAYIVMPNHVHGILFINENAAGSAEVQKRPGASKAVDGQAPQTRVGARHASPLQRPHGARKGSLGAIIGAYKSSVTRAIRQPPNPPSRQIWQHNYYERVVRNEEELNSLRTYVEYNYLKPLVYKE